MIGIINRWNNTRNYRYIITKKYHTCNGIYDIRKCKTRIRKYNC